MTPSQMRKFIWKTQCHPQPVSRHLRFEITLFESKFDALFSPQSYYYKEQIYLLMLQLLRIVNTPVQLRCAGPLNCADPDHCIFYFFCLLFQFQLHAETARYFSPGNLLNWRSLSFFFSCNLTNLKISNKIQLRAMTKLRAHQSLL